MAGKILAEKMKLRSGMRAAVVKAPDNFRKELSAPRDLELGNTLDAGPFDWLQIFILNSRELKTLSPKIKTALSPTGLVWLTFPKGTSGTQTDLTRDAGWEPLQPLDLKWVTLVSVNETWSAFAMRPYKKGEKKQTFRL
jgi:hypothetical protein